MQHESVDIRQVNRQSGQLGRGLVRGGLGLGVIGLGGAVAAARFSADGPERLGLAWLMALAYFLSLTLGALFFVILQHLTRAGWSVVLRRLAENIAGGVTILALLTVPVLLGVDRIYPWAEAQAAAGDQLLAGKQVWLNVPFFCVRVVVYLLTWILLARFYRRASVRQDESGDVNLTLRMQRLAAPAMVLFGLTVTFAAFDLLMSLDPHWFSTIFGVYFFAGGVVGFFAVLTLLVLLMQSTGRLRGAITPEHHHDLGKLIFAFVVFWAYIAFSQYMLIWYANLPEETGWYLLRQSGAWRGVSLALLAGHFVVPFLVLMSRGAKRRPAVLAGVSAWVLLMHLVDIYWLVMPGTRFAADGRVPLHVLDLLCLVGVGGLLVAAVSWRMGRHALLPERDPRLAESLAFENV